MKAIIIGAGIGGLCAGIALQNAGTQVAIYEQAAAPRAAGAGLSLWPNAVCALRGLGVNVDEIGAVFDGGIRRAEGTVLSRIDSTTLQARFGAPTLAVHRVDLLHLLLHQAGEVVTYGKRLAGYTQNADRICVRFDDGSTDEGDLLIGADGIHSAVRRQMHPASQSIYRGYPAWRGIANFDHTYGVWGETWGHGARFGIVPLSDGRIYWFASANRPADTPPDDHRATLHDLFGAWHNPIPALIDATPDDALLYNDISDIEPLSTWIDGRALLLGDAAHAMTPNMGQGACQAIEDASMLGQVLTTHNIVTHALRAYEAARLPHTKRVLLRSRSLGSIGQMSNPLLVALRDTMTRLTPAAVTLRGLDFVLAAQ